MATLKEQAYMRRAGLIGILQSCFCTWPAVIYPTETGHDERCTAHVWLLNRMGASRVELSPHQCCERDHDHDGQCDVHAAQGVLRAEFKR